MSPEFLINFDKIPGLPVGRFYVPYSHPFFNQHNFVLCCNSADIREITPCSRARVYWFIASISEYRRLAILYPHHNPSYRAKTFRILHSLGG
jgi:hypothetical protein